MRKNSFTRLRWQEQHCSEIRQIKLPNLLVKHLNDRNRATNHRYQITILDLLPIKRHWNSLLHHWFRLFYFDTLFLPSFLLRVFIFLNSFFNSIDISSSSREWWGASYCIWSCWRRNSSRSIERRWIWNWSTFLSDWVSRWTRWWTCGGVESGRWWFSNSLRKNWSRWS